MSALFSSIKNIAGNYSQGMMTIQAQLEDMKFGFLPPPSAAAATTTNRTRQISSKEISDSINMSKLGSTTVNSTSDFNQWLHAMKMVARLPGGTPPEFRRKLWLALADRYLHTSGIDWNKEQSKCLSEAWLDDDEELGAQIVKDLHRTGSSLFSGPNGNLNQAKLKRILIGYARWNPEVGYCQGFNMLGALILQVMEKSEIDSLKVMIYLIEGVLPNGYFSGSLGGLQADMAVFREILAVRLPKLSKHLQKLQGPVGEGSFEPPLINVFTMQWFLTLFCTCLPKNCVLRVWDLILIEGSDILLRTALAIWGLLEARIVLAKSADDFYCRMGTCSSEILNGHLFDSNSLIQRIVDLGPIADLQKMREKHLYNITPWKDRRGLRIFYSDDDGDSDEESWKLLAGTRKTSSGLSSSNNTANRSQTLFDTRDRIALDISLLKKQYEKLRERQRQAHIILTNTAKQTVNPSVNNSSLQINQYLLGRNAIVSSKGRRIGPPAGAIPPARLITLNQPVKTLKSSATAKQHKRSRYISESKFRENKEFAKRLTPDEMHLKSNDTNFNLQKSPSATSSISSVSSTSDTPTTSKKTSRRKKSESSSYSEEDSDDNIDENDDIDGDYEIVGNIDGEEGDFEDDSSSTSTSLCDEEDGNATSSIEASPLRIRKPASASTSAEDSRSSSAATNVDNFKKISYTELNKLPSSPQKSTSNLQPEKDEIFDFDTKEINQQIIDITNLMHRKSSEENNEDNQITETEILDNVFSDNEIFGENYKKMSPFTEQITSTSQLSPIADITKFLSTSTISPLKTPAINVIPHYPLPDFRTLEIISKPKSEPDNSESNFDDMDIFKDIFKVSDEGVTNQYFERVNQVSERPSRLELNEIISENLCKTTGLKQPDGARRKSTEPIAKSTTGSAHDTLEEPLFEREKLLNQDTAEKPQDINIEKGEKEIDFKQNYIREKSISLDDGHALDKKCEKFVSKTDNKVFPVSCPESASSADSNKNTDRVLKIIEENSKILERIMNKNPNLIKEDEDGHRRVKTKARDRSSERKLSPIPKTKAECLEYFETAEERRRNSIEKSLSQSELQKLAHSSHGSDSNITKSLNFDLLPILSKDESSSKNKSDNLDIRLLQSEILSTDNEQKNSSRHDDASTSKETSFNEYISSLISSLSETSDDEVNLDDTRERKKERKSISGKEARDKHKPLIESNIDKVDLKKEVDFGSMPTLGLEQHDRQTFDQEKLNEVESKRDQVPKTESSSEISDEPKSKRNSSYLEPSDASIDGSECSGDISATLCSIKNTIKSIDSLCEDDKRRSRERTDKTLNDIIKVVEKLEEEKDKKSNRIKHELHEKSAIPVLIETPLSSTENLIDIGKRRSPERHEQPSRYLLSSRYSRDRRRDYSPRRRNKEDNFQEYASRARRDKSPMAHILAGEDHQLSGSTENVNFSAETSPKSDYESHRSNSSPYKTNEKFEIRHTTVTSTFYDRYLSQQKERQEKLDKSPPSPVITKAYLESLKPPTTSSSYQSSSDSRNSRSAENSPSHQKSNLFKFDVVAAQQSPNKIHFTTAPRSGYLLQPQLPINVIDSSTKYTKSCDNIPSNLKSHQNRTDYNLYETDPVIKRHSAAGAFYTATPSLPSKQKKPSELGIKLGLYKQT